MSNRHRRADLAARSGVSSRAARPNS
jgi:hypothetical protein